MVSIPRHTCKIRNWQICLPCVTAGACIHLHTPHIHYAKTIDLFIGPGGVINNENIFCHFNSSCSFNVQYHFIIMGWTDVEVGILFKSQLSAERNMIVAGTLI